LIHIKYGLKIKNYDLKMSREQIAELENKMDKLESDIINQKEKIIAMIEKNNILEDLLKKEGEYIQGKPDKCDSDVKSCEKKKENYDSKIEDKKKSRDKSCRMRDIINLPREVARYTDKKDIVPAVFMYLEDNEVKLTDYDIDLIIEELEKMNIDFDEIRDFLEEYNKL